MVELYIDPAERAALQKALADLGAECGRVMRAFRQAGRAIAEMQRMQRTGRQTSLRRQARRVLRESRYRPTRHDKLARLDWRNKAWPHRAERWRW